MSEKAIIFILISFLLGLVVSIYSISSSGQFVYDDYPFVVENSYIKSLHNFTDFFASKFSVSRTGHLLYRPLRTLSFAVDYAVGRMNPRVYHMHNILLHCMNILLLFWLMRRIYISCSFSGGGTDTIFRASVFAFLSVFIWALHPVQTESVCWISSRGDLQAAFFLLTMLMFLYYSLNLRRMDKTFYLASILFAACAMLSKESAAVAPLLVWLFLSYGFSDGKKPSYKVRIFATVPFLCMAILFFILRYAVIGTFAQAGFWGNSLSGTFLAMFEVYRNYIFLMLFPVGLHITYNILPVSSVLDPIFLFSFTIVIFTVAGVSVFARKNRLIAFAALWFVVNIIPVSNIAPIKGAMMTEHFLYLPLVFWAVSGALLIINCGEMLRKFRWRWVRYCKEVLIVSVFTVYAVLTALRCVDWRTELSIWQKDYVLNSENADILMSMANAYHRAGNAEKACRFYQASILKDPTREGSYINLSDIYLGRGDIEKACKYAKKAVTIDGENSDAYWSLGKALAAGGMTNEAILSMEKAIALFPGRIDYYIDLGVLYDKSGRLDDAISLYKKALAMNWKEPKIHNNLGIAYQKSDKWQKALYHWQEALRIDPESTSALSNIRYCIIK